MTKTIIKVENISIRFNGKNLVENLNFDINEKETIGIFGPNGSGKTTLIKSILNFASCKRKVRIRTCIAF